jgi:sugar/nucleoside kinase (ribokinase family)
MSKTAEMCGLMVCTRSGDGVTIIGAGARHDIPVQTITPVDATGAGDQFAAGFLYGVATGQPLDVCGKMGNLCAAEVISHLGPRPEADMMARFKNAGLA